MFINRRDAGERLAKALEEYRDKSVVVLGIPRGGTETAFYVADYLDAEFSLIFSKKLGHPYNPELAIGAVAEDGSIFINEYAKEYFSQQLIMSQAEEKKKEIQERIQKLRYGEPLPEIKGKTIIIVDDGIATGSTIFASIKLCQNKGAGKIIVAAPIGSQETEEEIRKEADEVVILEKPLFYQAVSQGYQSFYDLTDEETIAFLNRWKKEKH